MENNEKICQSCHQPILPEYYFCPNCGKNLKESKSSTSLITQVGLYLLAIFLPPLGLWPGIKYLMKKNKQAKIIGAIVLSLTIISSIITIWTIFNIFEMYMSEVNTLMNGI